MSSRAPSSYYVRPSQSSPRPYDRNPNRDRDGPRGHDREARDIRSRSRSPKRERSRSRSPKRERYDERGNSPFLLSTLIPLTLPTIFPLACTERGYDRSREFAPPARGDYRGGRGRDYGSERYDSRRRHEERNDRDRPLDRRAIEAGRRRREEERAKGIVAEEPKAVPTGELLFLKLSYRDEAH